MDRTYKQIALDLDGTLLNDKKEISPANRRVLHEALLEGVHVVIASGRPYQALPQEIRQFDGIEYAITSNGSSIFHMKEDRRVFGQDLTRESVLALLPLIRRSKIPCEAAISGNCFTPADYYRDPAVFGLPARIKDYVQRTRRPIDHMPDFIEAHAGEIEGIFLLIPDPEKMIRIRNSLRQIPGLYLTSSTPYYLEIADASVSKARSLDWLCRQLQVRREETLAFGDSGNDRELLEFAGTGVAMANATVELKKLADAVTLSNEEDGVAYYLNHL